MQCIKMISVIVCLMFITVMTGAYAAQCDIQTDVTIMPQKIKIGKIRTFKVKVELPKAYDLRSWTITDMTCGNVSALPGDIKKQKHHVIASFSTQGLLYLDDGKLALSVTVTAEKNDETVVFTGSDMIRFQNYAEAAVACGSLETLNINDPEFHQPLEISSAELVPASPIMPEYCKVSGAVGNDGFELRLRQGHGVESFSTRAAAETVASYTTMRRMINCSAATRR